jgi:hypothetical protein
VSWTADDCGPGGGERRTSTTSSPTGGTNVNREMAGVYWFARANAPGGVTSPRLRGAGEPRPASVPPNDSTTTLIFNGAPASPGCEVQSPAANRCTSTGLGFTNGSARNTNTLAAAAYGLPSGNRPDPVSTYCAPSQCCRLQPSDRPVAEGPVNRRKSRFPSAAPPVKTWPAGAKKLRTSTGAATPSKRYTNAPEPENASNRLAGVPGSTASASKVRPRPRPMAGPNAKVPGTGSWTARNWTLEVPGRKKRNWCSAPAPKAWETNRASVGIPAAVATSAGAPAASENTSNAAPPPPPTSPTTWGPPVFRRTRSPRRYSAEAADGPSETTPAAVARARTRRSVFGGSFSIVTANRSSWAVLPAPPMSTATTVRGPIAGGNHETGGRGNRRARGIEDVHPVGLG